MRFNWKLWLLASAILTSTYGARHAFADSLETPLITPMATKGSEFLDIGTVSPERQKAIEEAMQLGLINGYPNGNFKPDQKLTREELAVMLAKALELPLQAPTSPSFADVQSGDWGLGYVEAVKAAGLMIGSDSEFRPNAPVTREELAAIFVRALHGENTTGGNVANADDLSAASGWAESSVQTAIRLGLMNTDTDRFQPKQQVVRQDIAQFLVDIFPEREQTATVTSVDGDVITINGTPYLVTDDLKKLLLNDSNVDALQGAVLHFKSAVRSVNDLSEMEIVSSGTSEAPVNIDATGMPNGSTLKVSGDHVNISGGSVDNVILQGQASSVSIDAQVNQLEVLSAKPITLSGTGNFKELVVGDTSKLTIGSHVKIDKLVLPEGANPSDCVQNLDQVKSQIGTVTTPAGTSVSNPVPTPVTQPVVTQTNSDQDAVSLDRQALAVGYINGDTASSVTSNLTLGDSGSHGTTVTWSSSNANVIATDGTVTRPAYTASDATVELTAMITKGNEQDTKTFTLTVKKLAETDAEAVAAEKAVLAVGYSDGDTSSSVTGNLTLSTAGVDGTTVTWSSSNESVIATDGTVTRPAYTASDATVELTATITKGNEQDTKTFTLTVKKAVATANSAPMVANTIPNKTVILGDSMDAVDTSTIFSDADQLIITADSSNPEIADVTVDSNGSLLFNTYQPGTVTVTVYANDGTNPVVPTNFTLTVLPESATIISADIDQSNKVVTITFDRPIHLNPDLEDPENGAPAVTVEYYVPEFNSSQIENFDGTATIDPSDNSKLTISFPTSLKDQIGDVPFDIYVVWGYVDEDDRDVSVTTDQISFNGDSGGGIPG